MSRKWRSKWIFDGSISQRITEKALKTIRKSPGFGRKSAWSATCGMVYESYCVYWRVNDVFFRIRMIPSSQKKQLSIKYWQLLKLFWPWQTRSCCTAPCGMAFQRKGCHCPGRPCGRVSLVVESVKSCLISCHKRCCREKSNSQPFTASKISCINPTTYM